MSPRRKLSDNDESLPPHLQKRGRKFYFRIAVPKDLQHFFPGKQKLIRIALKTSIRRTADGEYLRYEKLADHNFTALRQPNLHSALIAQLVSELVPKLKKTFKQPTQYTTIQDIIDKYKENNSHDKKTLKTQQEYTYSYKMLIKHFDNKPLILITSDDCEGYRKKLIEMSDKKAEQKKLANVMKQKQYELKQLANGQEVIGQRTPLKRESNTNINKHLEKLHALLELAVTKDLIHRNPAKGLTLEAKKVSYLQFDDADIQLIVNILPLPESKKNWKPSWLWVPLITMFTGARKNEVCQLYKSDIKEMSGILCFHFSVNIYDDDSYMNDDKRIKTGTSRFVPVHSKLIELGFLKYFEQVKTPRIFPELSCHRDGYGHAFKWFDLNFPIKHPQKVPSHSFRHTVSNKMNDASIILTHRADILGHEKGSVTTNRIYTDRTLITVLKEAIETVRYDVDFLRLTPPENVPVYVAGHRMMPRKLDLD